MHCASAWQAQLATTTVHARCAKGAVRDVVDPVANAAQGHSEFNGRQMDFKSLIDSAEYGCLRRESAFASECLATGLTDLRRFDTAKKGKFYSGCSLAALGLERLLKIAVVMEHDARCGQPPTNEQLKRDYGHDLDKLVECVRARNNNLKWGVDGQFLDDPLVMAIVHFLSDYARSARYYNLDYLTKHGQSLRDEPLARWDREIGSEIVRRHGRRTPRSRNDHELARRLDRANIASVLGTAHDGSVIRSFADAVNAGQHDTTKSRYFVYYVYLVVRFAVRALEAIEIGRASPTYLYEYFHAFSLQDQRMILKTKRWQA